MPRLVLLIALVAPLALGACESSQTTSARLAKRAAKAAVLGKVRLATADPGVRIRTTRLVRGDGATAAVVELENTGKGALVDVPIQVVAKDAKGAAVYRNDTQGLQPSLQQLSYLPRGAKAFWINDQVTTTTPVRKLSARVGRSKVPGAPKLVPHIGLSQTKLETDGSGTFIKGFVRNHSKIAQVNMPIYGIVRKGRRIVAAGRALLDRLPPYPTPKPIVFRILLVGKVPKGASFELIPSPTTFAPEGAPAP